MPLTQQRDAQWVDEDQHDRLRTLQRVLMKARQNICAWRASTHRVASAKVRITRAVNREVRAVESCPVWKRVEARREHAEDLGARRRQHKEREQQRCGRVLALDVLGGVTVVRDACSAHDDDENSHQERSERDEVEV